VRSLFIRIFLWFWAATVLLVAVLVGTVYLTEPDIPFRRWHNLTRGFLTLYAHDLAQVYERGGCDAARTFLQQQNPFRERQNHRYLTDAVGNNICGSALPAGISSLARSAAASSQEKAIRSETLTLTASPVRLPSGNTYVLLFHLPRGRQPWSGASPETWLLRILALMATAGVVCYGLARYFADPVRRLRAVARRFASGDLTARVGDDHLLRRRDELSQLGTDFDYMANRIEELVTRQEKLLASQRRLLGDISHELRSPLTRLGLASGLLHRRVTEDAKPLLERIDRESERLNTLIGHLLMLARLDASPGPPISEVVDLKQLLENIIVDAEFEAENRNVRIDLNACETCILNGSPELLRSALENVIRNAIRYTAPGTVVLVELQCTRNNTSVTVSDSGPGVPEKDLPHLFEPFYRVAEARDRTSGGTGLGLAITERTVRLHRGTIEALNRPKGGLSVCMSFPEGRAVEPSSSGSANPAASTVVQ
jgi:two-component system sensor histidine kinase CpxA